MEIPWDKIAKIGTVIGMLIGAITFIANNQHHLPATRGWVKDEALVPYYFDSLTLLRVRRQLDETELFQWQLNTVKTPGIQLQIERLKADIAEIDKEIERRLKPKAE